MLLARRGLGKARRDPRSGLRGEDVLVETDLGAGKAPGELAVPYTSIGEAKLLLTDELIQLDHVAYVRFASVYRSFQDVSEFTDMIEDLQKK